MHLSQLRIRNFRCLEHVDVEPAPGINIIIGANASGKSSLLEAIYYLARAQSFRGALPERMICQGFTELSVFGRLSSNGTSQPIGIVRQGRQTRIKIGAEEGRSILQLVEALPVQVINPQIQQLLEEGPDQRRRFLDWGVFHVERAFYPAWLRFQRALRQRNHALRERSTNEHIAAWDREYIDSAAQIDAQRRAYLDQLKPQLMDILGNLLESSAIEIDYNPGWQQEHNLAEALRQGAARDREQGYTQSGPHRADLRFRMAGRQVRANASRGEQKLLSAGLLLAQARLLRERTGRLPILLIDDLAAELDADHRNRLFRQIAALQTQCFLSFLDQGILPQGEHTAAMFHVEHGRVTPMV